MALPACGQKDSADQPDSGGTSDHGDADPGETSDSHGDTILDLHKGHQTGATELSVDTDEDGEPDYQDLESDGDGLDDGVEAGDRDLLTLPLDADGDTVEDFRDLDSDDNCIPDADEAGVGPADTDGDGIHDLRDSDNDGDGLSDVTDLGEDCAELDSDYDGSPDYMDTDSDGDGIGDAYEAGSSAWDDSPADTDGDGMPDYRDTDSDGDGILDSDESGVSSPDQEPRDTDGDGAYDFADTDADGDGLSDDQELAVYGTDPYDADSDGDGFTDGGESAAGTDPTDSTSVMDGIYVEVGERTEVEEDFEFDIRIQMGDIAFMVDTTGSMTTTAQAMAGEFSVIATQIALSIPYAQYGYATHDDYAYGGMGTAGGDKPFELRKQITSSTSQVQAAMAAAVIHKGADSPESSLEALSQGAVGIGYDQDCDTV